MTTKGQNIRAQTPPVPSVSRMSPIGTLAPSRALPPRRPAPGATTDHNYFSIESCTACPRSMSSNKAHFGSHVTP